MNKRKHNHRPAVKPVDTYDGWTEPSTKDVEPQDYPWESPKI
jgi:hypothetical protein